MNIESMRTRPYRSFKVDDAELPAALKEIGVSRRTMSRRRCAARSAKVALLLHGVREEDSGPLHGRAGRERHTRVLPPRPRLLRQRMIAGNS